MASSQPQPRPYRIHVVGAPRTPLRDAYHMFLRVPWRVALGLIVAGYLVLNAVFAIVYMVIGGVAHAEPGAFLDAYYFSVQTMGTIGYGDMHPVGSAANAVMVVESVAGLLTTALATGLVFAKFARSTARMAFSRCAVISPVDGVPTLMIRVGNERGNQIVEARLRAVLLRTEKTREGVTLYRMHDLRLLRERAPVLTRSWTMMHRIEGDSVLAGRTPEDLATDESELIVTMVGIDDTSNATVHAVRRYTYADLKWGARFADILRETETDDMVLDLSRFHQWEPTEPIEGFPYPR